MKKLVCCVLCMLILVSCLTGCNVTSNVTDVSETEAEATPKVEEMMLVLAENRISDAKELMHPEVAEQADAALVQMSDYLSGREATAVEVNSISISTSVGASGKSRQEQVIYRVLLDDNSSIYLNVQYYSDASSGGFTSFQVVLGVF